jgi:hypothetical protein
LLDCVAATCSPATGTGCTVSSCATTYAASITAYDELVTCLSFNCTNPVCPALPAAGDY